MMDLTTQVPECLFAVERFRPNLVIEWQAGGSYPENEWVGKRLRIGADVVVNVSDPCPRCAMPTLDQGGLPQDPRVLRAIAHNNFVYTPALQKDEPCLGAYAFVSWPGRVVVGDHVTAG